MNLLAAYIDVIAVITSKTMIRGFDISSNSFNPTCLSGLAGNLISSKFAKLGSKELSISPHGTTTNERLGPYDAWNGPNRDWSCRCDFILHGHSKHISYRHASTFRFDYVCRSGIFVSWNTKWWSFYQWKSKSYNSCDFWNKWISWS